MTTFSRRIASRARSVLEQPRLVLGQSIRTSKGDWYIVTSVHDEYRRGDDHGRSRSGLYSVADARRATEDEARQCQAARDQREADERAAWEAKNAARGDFMD